MHAAITLLRWNIYHLFIDDLMAIWSIPQLNDIGLPKILTLKEKTWQSVSSTNKCITCGYWRPRRAWSFAFWSKGCHCYLITCGLSQVPQYHHSNISTASVNTLCIIWVIIIGVFPIVDSVSKKTSISVLLREWIPLNFYVSKLWVWKTDIPRCPARN